MAVDRIAKLQHLLEVLAFSLVIATVQYAFTPDRPYASLVTYSLFIGVIIWAVIDLGREIIPSARETGWPQGWQGIALTATGIACGFGIGRVMADQVCRRMGFYDGFAPPDPAVELRNAVIITLLAGTVGTFYFYSRSKSAYLERKMGEVQRHANEARLKLLESQLEPHMLFNTLANLRALIGVDPPQAQAMLDRLNDFLRATLGASRTTMHPLGAEFARLRDYLALMAVRMGARLQVRFDLPDDLANVPVPTLVLQPLVENAIRHGLEPKIGSGFVQINAQAQGRFLLLEVTDSGVGLGAAPAPRDGAGGGGFGLEQVRERLATLYGDAASVQLEPRPEGGTHARVRLPLPPLPPSPPAGAPGP